MRNVLLFLALLVASLTGALLAPETPFTGEGYGLQSPPPVCARFEATTRCYLEPVQQLRDILAMN